MKGFVGILISALAVAAAFFIIGLVVSPVSAAPVYIAQGDPVQFQVNHPAGHCWYFPSVAKEDYQKFYAIPASQYQRENYTCDLSSSQTANMPEGDYTLIYVYPSKLDTGAVPSQYLSDVSWSNNSLVSLFGERRDESGSQSYMVMKDLKEMVSQSKLDRLEEYEIAVQPPSLNIRRQEGTGWDLITVSGESNLANGTVVRIEIDEDVRDTEVSKDVSRYYSFTNYTAVIRKYVEEKGAWSYVMHLPIQFMTPGWHTTTVYAGGLQSSARFPIYQAFAPEPTPKQYINYFGNGSLKPDVVTVTVPVPGPTRVVELWHTPAPTPTITDALGDKVDGSGPVVPAWAGIAGLVTVLVTVLVGVMSGGRK